MGRTKTNCRKSTGGKAPRRQLGLPRGAVLVKDPSDDDVKPELKQENDQRLASGSTVKHEQSSSPKHSFNDLMEDDDEEKKVESRSPRKGNGRAAAVSWSKEETKALLDVQYEVAKENIPRFLEKDELAGRNWPKIYMKLKGMHAAAVKALDAGPGDVKPKPE
ncbi:hypothetical protein NDA16_002130 [Ustilago loliicola]|nr:hypothetical protein NDA16_002130 [Ustilago loliicola]